MKNLQSRGKMLIAAAALLAGGGMLGAFARGNFQFDMGTSRGPMGPVSVQLNGNFGKQAEPSAARETTIYVPVPGRTNTTDDERRMIAEYMKMQDSLKVIEVQTRKQLEESGAPLPKLKEH